MSNVLSSFLLHKSSKPQTTYYTWPSHPSYASRKYNRMIRPKKEKEKGINAKTQLY
jgi:hypothetical protein